MKIVMRQNIWDVLDIYGSDELDSVDDIHYIIVSQMTEREKESQNENT